MSRIFIDGEFFFSFQLSANKMKQIDGTERKLCYEYNFGHILIIVGFKIAELLNIHEN